MISRWAPPLYGFICLFVSLSVHAPSLQMFRCPHYETVLWFFLLIKILLEIYFVHSIAVLAQPGALEVASVSQWVRESVANFSCLNDQAWFIYETTVQSLSVQYMCVQTTQTVCTTQSGIEQVNWHERRYCSQLLSGDDWEGSIGTRVSIAVSYFPAEY